jgi:amino acid transporter
MPDQSAAIVGIAPVPAARLEPDAIGAAQDTVIGMASAAPAVSTGLTLAGLAAVSAYAGGLVIILTAIPMLIIANSYRRLNLWNANCGASFEWVGRAINPYLGFMTGWLMVIGSIIGTLGPVVVLGPSVLAVFGAPSTATWPNVAIGTTVVLVMLIIAVAGIRLTARTQVALGLVEYAILIGFAVAGLLLVLRHHPGTYPITRDWFTLRGIGGRGSLAAGFLVAVFAFTGWDGTI